VHNGEQAALVTTVVGSYPQPNWLIDRERLGDRLPPRVRARELWRIPERFLEEAQDDATRLAITEQGRAVFQAWLTTPVERPREIRLLFLLKLYFMQSIMPQQVSHLVEQEMLACQRFLAHLESQRLPASSTSDTAFLERVVLSSRIHQTRALLDWLRELQEEFAEAR